MMELHVSNLQSSGFHSCFCEKYITRSSLAINWSSTSSFLHAIFLQKGKDFPWHVKKPMSSRSLVKHGWRALVEHAALGANIALAVERSTAAHHAELGDLVDTSSSYRHVWARYTETFAMSLRFFGRAYGTSASRRQARGMAWNRMTNKFATTSNSEILKFW